MNMQEFNEEFDGMNPPIDIPDEVAEYVDNDYDLPYSPPNLDGEWTSGRKGLNKNNEFANHWN